MAKKYIELDIAKEIVKRLAFSECSPFDKQEAIDGIESVPAADVEEVKHGRWIEDGDVQICSECGEEHEWADYRAPYCDICGAKMDGMSKLKPCPFCGGEAKLYSAGFTMTKIYAVECMKCNVMYPLIFADEGVAIEKWNKREGERK